MISQQPVHVTVDDEFSFEFVAPERIGRIDSVDIDGSNDPTRFEAADDRCIGMIRRPNFSLLEAVILAENGDSSSARRSFT